LSKKRSAYGHHGCAMSSWKYVSGYSTSKIITAENLANLDNVYCICSKKTTLLFMNKHNHIIYTPQETL
jgi:hypothetical protein